MSALTGGGERPDLSALPVERLYNRDCAAIRRMHIAEDRGMEDEVIAALLVTFSLCYSKDGTLDSVSNTC